MKNCFKDWSQSTSVPDCISAKMFLIKTILKRICRRHEKLRCMQTLMRFSCQQKHDHQKLGSLSVFLMKTGVGVYTMTVTKTHILMKINIYFLFKSKITTAFIHARKCTYLQVMFSKVAINGKMACMHCCRCRTGKYPRGRGCSFCFFIRRLGSSICRSAPPPPKKKKK